jgi:3-polyprenyl-4-hydroxybenzoate decarboxylase
LVVLVDNAAEATCDESAFLWTAFTRFEPAADLYASKTELARHHPMYTPPIVIDARMKPWYPGVVECDPATAALVERRWRDYFPKLV